MRAPTLLVVGSRNPTVLELNRAALAELRCRKELKAPLDLGLVRKIGAPLQPELAVAAVVDGCKPSAEFGHLRSMI